jgi:tetratricopeptide (TPR) repeat protein
MPTKELGDQDRRLLEELADAAAGDAQPGQLRALLGVEEDVLDAMERYAHDLYRHGRLERAGTIIEGLLALDHTRHYPYLLVGDIALQNAAWSDAARCFEAAINFCDEPTALLYGKLGEAHVRAGAIEEGIPCLRLAMDIGDPQDKYVRRSAAILETIVESVDAVASNRR